MTNFFHIYVRALKLLGNEAKLGWSLAIANLLLALAHFAEPILLGWVINVLTAAQVKSMHPTLDYDGVYSKPGGFWSADQFIEAVYKNLSANK